MQCGVVSVEQDESVYTAIGILVDKHLSGLPVVDQGKLVGIISEKDVLGVLYESQHVTGNVSDYMTKEVLSFDIEDSLEDIALALINHNFRRVAILEEGNLCGIISRADLIQDYVSSHKIPSWQEDCDGVDNVPLAKDVMKYGLLTVGRQTTLFEAAEILFPKKLTGLPVVDNGMHLQGIVSEKDILRTLFDPNATGSLVNDIMTENVVSFAQTDSLADICDCLIHNDFRRVPILTDGRLVGIVSRADIMMCILKHKSAISRAAVLC
ncbi:MAG: CBS domain-containing protein [Phycisphaerae bacterium]|nr:CBS domain-containing protein [Phycisphaerae bacterium]